MQAKFNLKHKSNVYTQGPEEFRVNKGITYLLTLKYVYTCRLARLISPMGSL